MNNFKLRKLACFLSSLLLISISISPKVSCIDSNALNISAENSYIRLDMRLVFGAPGLPWAIRESSEGDAAFFNCLYEYFYDKTIYENYTSEDFENEMYKLFKEISGEELTLQTRWVKIPFSLRVRYIPSYESHVDANWWVKGIIPEVKKRFEIALQIKKSENLCCSVEKILKESEEKIKQFDKDYLNRKISDLRDRISENYKGLRGEIDSYNIDDIMNNMEEIKKSRDELQKNMFDVSSKLYQQNSQQPEQNSQQNSQQNSNGTQGNENVYDANYKDVNENDKK